jgi:TolA-binding protein
MSNSAKVPLYIMLVILASISGYFAFESFGTLMSRSANRNADLEQIEPERQAPADTTATNQPSVTDTNTVAAATNSANAVLSNTVSPTTVATNAAAAADSGTITNAGTNAVAAQSGTNAANSNQTVKPAGEGETAVPTAGSAGQPPAKNKPAKHGGHLGTWLALFLVSLVGLGLLLANDISHYFGNRALKVLYNDEGDGLKTPEYEKAEETWANGDHLEAIRMMREYLNKNPKEQHVAMRIAEIYEKDLNNPLAAALEYEEVLKQKLPEERWGWAAIHLCNLYFRLNQEQKAVDLLRRIVTEHPKVAAAEKARKRLEQLGELPPAPAIPETGAPPARDVTVQASSPAAPHLPPGFRPKK